MFVDHHHLSWADLPDSLACLFQLIGQSEILVKYFTGSTAAKVLSRFSYLDSEIEALCTEITNQEQKLAGDKILAEIIHLSENRTGNVLLHPAFRPYEIPYLGRSSRDTEQQIHIDDIMVSVRNKHITLRSKKLDKHIIPRLTNAHNFSYNSQPIYHFLGDYQEQHIRNCLAFEWGSISALFKFLPRVRYKSGIILSPAEWRFTHEDLKTVMEENAISESAMREFRDKWQIPDRITLVESDNELLIDFNNKLSVATFTDFIRNRKSVILREFLFDSDKSVIRDTHENAYNSECIATLIRQPVAHKHQSIVLPTIKPAAIQTVFPAGSEWFVFQIILWERRLQIPCSGRWSVLWYKKW